MNSLAESIEPYLSICPYGNTSFVYNFIGCKNFGSQCNRIGRGNFTITIETVVLIIKSVQM